MKAILTLISAIFGKVGDFIVGRLGMRLAIRTAVVTAYIAAVLALNTTVNALIMGIALNVPQWVQTALYCLPSNTGPCISAIGAGYAASWVFVQMTTIASVKGRV